jgi:hypothetical protein
MQTRGTQFYTVTLVTSPATRPRGVPYFPLNTIFAIVCNCMFEVPS